LDAWVLVVTDERTERGRLCDWLKLDLQVDALAVRGTEDALVQSAVARPTVVVGDAAAIPALKAAATLQGVPLVAIAIDRRQGRRTGAAAVVGRPVDRAELVAAVAAVLRTETGAAKG
jgi:DNA-binding response OmpR family regulator